MSPLTAIVLAAGQGTRMRGGPPKVLHRLCGRALVEFPIRAALEAGATRVVVVTSGQPEIPEALTRGLPGVSLSFVTQDPPRGTGDAARVGLESVTEGMVLILYGDTPLIGAPELAAVAAAAERSVLAFMSAEQADPRGYGRVMRDDGGRVVAIREERDLASDDERAIREVNAGIYAARAGELCAAVAGLQPNNAQGEYYLTDVVAATARSGSVVAVRGPAEAMVGVNDREQLRAAEEALFERIRRRLARSGVTVRGDARIDDTVAVEPGAEIGPGVSLRGATRVGAGAVIDVGNVVVDSEIAARALLKPYCVVTKSRVGEGAELGPFAHLRPESEIEADAHIGNFVETKKTRVRRGAKANHLSYLGDADIGERANVGAGTIICNYDGFQKQRTVIGEGAFIGSDSQLIAPVSVGKGAYVGTATTVTEDVPDDALAIGRTRQSNKPGYAKALRERLAAAAREAKK